TTIAGHLDAEAGAARTHTAGWQAKLPLWRSAAPSAFGADVPDRALEDLADRARSAAVPASGWWGRRRVARTDRKLRRSLGAAGSTPLPALAEAIDQARALRAAARLASTGGTAIGELWSSLVNAEEDLRSA